MSSRSVCRGMAVGIVALALVSVVHASPILTLFNTGVNNNGAVLNDGTLDTHYSLVVVPSGAAAVLKAHTAGYPIPPWVGSDGLSAWIGPNSDSVLNSPVGDYTYRTTFDLTPYNLATVVITGRWTMDNSGVALMLNGAPTAAPVPADAFTSFHDFTLTGGLLKNDFNQLDFVINNGSIGGQDLTLNPTGLRVEFTASGDLLAPEPASFLLFGAGLVALSMIPRKRTQAAKSK